MRGMVSHEAGDERSRILAYWWMLELFSPQSVPSLTPQATRSAEHQVIEWEVGKPLPWKTLQPPRQWGRAEKVWRHTVYLGVYELAATYDSLGRVFGEDPDAYEKRPRGQSACAGVLVDQGGRLVADSGVLSSAAWAVGRTHRPGPSDPAWMEGFDAAADGFVRAVDELEGSRRDEAGAETPPPYDAESLMRLPAMAHAAAGIRGFDEMATTRVVIDSRVVNARDDDGSDDIDFLNSFFLDDLATVRTAVEGGDVGTALAEYLTGDDALAVETRIDVMEHSGIVDTGAGLFHLPKGRWPSNPGHPLALSQQFAVNHALNDLAAGTGLMGVNGPPGTGKTTMLRDILAGNVVERARRLAVLDQPADAFTDESYVWKDGEGWPRRVPGLRGDLTGFEMVVASANNAAVENITVEIPARDAIAEPWRGQADYFAEIATRALLATRSASEETDPDTDSDTGGGADSEAGPDDASLRAWGLVAARLGRKRNRGAFRTEFWFGETDPVTRKPLDEGVAGMQERLQRWFDGTDPHPTWSEARDRFRATEQRLDDLVQERLRAQERLQALPPQVEREHTLSAEVARLRGNLDRIEHDLAEHRRTEERTAAELARAVAAYERHLAAKPGVGETVLSLGRALREWRGQLAGPADQLRVVEQRQHESTQLGRQLRDTLEQTRLEWESTHEQLVRTRRDLDDLRRRCADDAERFKDVYPGPEWTDDRRQLNAPWHDDELNAARSDLFLAGLQLHQDFLANAVHVTDPDRDRPTSRLIDGMRAATDVVAGTYPHALDANKVRAAWQLFFLAVPLVSTTFASASRMFGDLGRESLGWLLIDEAGQAAPQYAAGAIWRAQRVIAVGDPLQLQPVITAPTKTLLNLAGHYSVSPTWIPPRASVQTLADRVTSYGTTLDQGEERIWVSAPLLCTVAATTRCSISATKSPTTS